MQRMRTPLIVMAVLGVALYGLWLVTEDDGTDPAPAAAIPVIAERVEALRDLRFEQIPRPVTVTPEQARREGLSDLDRNYPPERLRADEEILKLLGLIDEDADLRDLAGSRCSARAWPATTTRATGACAWSRAPGPATACSRRWSCPRAHAHLEDQRFGLPRTPATDDRSLARAALHEGTATALMTATIQEHFQRGGGARRTARLGVRGHRRPAAVHGGAGAVPIRGRERFAGHLLNAPAGAGTWSTPPTSCAPADLDRQVLHPRGLPARGRAAARSPARSSRSSATGGGGRRPAPGRAQTRELLGSARRGRLGRRPLALWRSDGDRALIMRWRWDTPRDVAGSSSGCVR